MKAKVVAISLIVAATFILLLSAGSPAGIPAGIPVVYAYSSYSVSGTLSSSICTGAGGTWSGSTCTIPSGVNWDINLYSGYLTLTVPSGATLAIHGTIQIHDNYAGGGVINYGTIEDYCNASTCGVGTLVGIVLHTTASITNYGTLIIENGGDIQNYGTITNECGSTYTVMPGGLYENAGGSVKTISCSSVPQFPFGMALLMAVAIPALLLVKKKQFPKVSA